MKLVHLSIDLEPAECLYCSKHYFSIAKVLRLMAKKLEHLKITRGSALLTRDVYLMSASTVFPRLETLKLRCEHVKANAELLKKVVNSATNLKEIIHKKPERAKELL